MNIIKLVAAKSTNVKQGTIYKGTLARKFGDPLRPLEIVLAACNSHAFNQRPFPYHSPHHQKKKNTTQQALRAAGFPPHLPSPGESKEPIIEQFL